MRILLTNDDGIHAPGLDALLEALRPLGHVTVVAPDRERSAVGHALTFHSPLRVRELSGEERLTRFVTDGTPTDCVLLALYSLMPERPDLLFSGINRGANLGDDITYSGTVSAAMEGLIHGIPSIAVSQVESQPQHYVTAATFAARLAGRLAHHTRMPPRTLLNVNVPDLPSEAIRGVQVTRQGHSLYDQQIVKRVDPRGHDYYWVTGSMPTGSPEEGTDFRAIQEDCISVTPLQTNMTHHALLEEIDSWCL